MSIFQNGVKFSKWPQFFKMVTNKDLKSWHWQNGPNLMISLSYCMFLTMQNPMEYWSKQSGCQDGRHLAKWPSIMILNSGFLTINRIEQFESFLASVYIFQHVLSANKRFKVLLYFFLTFIYHWCVRSWDLQYQSWTYQWTLCNSWQSNILNKAHI